MKLAPPSARLAVGVSAGYVVSDKMPKTIVVEFQDRNGIADFRGRVSLTKTRPLSATKRWRLVEIVEKAK